MKYLCDACERLVEPAAFRAEGEALLLRCARCGEESRHGPSTSALKAASGEDEAGPAPVLTFAPRPVPPPEPEPAITPAAPVPAAERCPKCATAKQGRSSCARCGLVFELYRPSQDVMPSSARRDFAVLLDGWGSPEADRVLERASTESATHLARLARHHLADFPGDARAEALLERLTARSLALAAAATQAEGMSRAGPGANPLKPVLIAVALVGALAAMAILTSLLQHTR